MANRPKENLIKALLELIPVSNHTRATAIIKQIVNNPNKSDKMMLATRAMITACQVCGCTLDDLMGKIRNRNVVTARMLTSHYIRTELHLTYEHIGNLLGGKDHATILHSLRKFSDLLEFDKQTQELYKEFNIILNTDYEINNLSQGIPNSTEPPLDVLVHRVIA